MLTVEKMKEIIVAAAENADRIHSRKQMCGCYNCFEIFPNDELSSENQFCAPGHKPYCVCEYCGIDSLICEDDLAGLAPLNEETLKAIYKVAFEEELLS